MDEQEIDCPRCGSEMETKVRSGVKIDTCPDCYGIFLDRGEFERLMGTESSTLGMLVTAESTAAGSST